MSALYQRVKGVQDLPNILRVQAMRFVAKSPANDEIGDAMKVDWHVCVCACV